MNRDYEARFERFVDLVATGAEWTSVLALLLVQASQDDILFIRELDEESVRALRGSYGILGVTKGAVKWLGEKPERMRALARALYCSRSPAGDLFRQALMF